MSRLLRRAALLAALLTAAGFLAFASYAELGSRPHQAAGWTRAISLARTAERTRAIVPAVRMRDQAVAQLQELASTGPASARSHALMLAGLLEVRNSQFEEGQVGALLGLAVSELQSAVRLDRTNDGAA